MLFVSTNNINNIERRPHLVLTHGWVRRPGEEGSERHATRMAKRLKKATSPIEEGTKTKMLAEFDSSEINSNDSNDGLSEGNNDTSHAKAPDDSSYCKGDEWLIEKSSLTKTMFASALKWEILWG
jgi:hypothetical protein